jgi:hypothetical protein
VAEGAEFVGDAIFNGEPVEEVEERGDVVSLFLT